MSRPNSSAPRRYCAPGGVRRSRSVWAYGSAGASSGAKRAAATMTATTARLTAVTRSGRLAMADPGIEDGVGEVGQQVDEDERGRHDEDAALDEVEVPGPYAGHHEPPDAGPGEDGLGEHGAAEQQ